MSNAASNIQTPQRFSGEWETKPVSEFGNVVTGGTPSTEISTFWNGPYPWITPTDITSERDLTVSKRMITQEGLKATITLPSNTVLVTCIASIGKNAILRTTGSCNRQINAVIPNAAHNAEFLYYLFEYNSDFLLANAGTTVIKGVSKSTFSNLVFKVPPLPEQRAIAEALSGVDELLNALEALITKKQEVKQTSMQRLLTGRTRLAGFSGKWETKRLGELGPLQNSIYLGHLMDHSIASEQKARMEQGDVVVHISANNLDQLQIKLPPITEQNAIASILFDMDAEITALEQRLDKTRSIKKGMMQQLLTKRVRLEKKEYTIPYQKSRYFKTPQKCEKIWRYMPIDKFMAMLSEESLYFPNIYLFNDRCEGELSSESLKEVYKTNLLHEKNTPIKQDDAFFREKENLESPLMRRHKDRSLKRLHSFETLLRDFSNHLMFCSSWFLKKNESHSMWAEYGDKRSPTSVAIQTTVGDLIQSFEPSSYQIHIGKVKYKNYKNYDKEHIGGYEDFLSKDLTDPNKVLELFYAPVLHKRKIYDDEKEVRAIISFESVCENYLDRIYTSEIPFYSDRLFEKDSRFFRADQTNIMKDIPKGISIKINLQTLLKKIVISPNANEYFHKPFRKLIKSHNIDPTIVFPSDI